MSNPKLPSITGGCLCGAVRYVITGNPIVSTLCHCRSCRRATGAPSVAWAVFSTADVSFGSGERAEFESSPGRWRSFCRRCGTPLTYRRNSESVTIDITIATLDSPDSIAPAREIWVEEKIAWDVVNPSMSQYPRSSRQQQ